MPDLDLLPADRAVTLTGEEHHQDVLAAYGPFPREVVVALVWCRIARGKYAGEHGVEARLGGRRIGELTHRMSERYAPFLEDALARGARPGCAAVLRAEARGIQAELRLPTADARPPGGTADGRPPGGTAAVRVPRLPSPPAPTPAGRPGTGTVGLPAHPATAAHPPPRSWTGPHATTAWPDHAYPEVVAPVAPAAPPAQRRRWPWAVAAVVAVFAVIGITTRDDGPPPPGAAGERTTVAAAPAGSSGTTGTPTTATSAVAGPTSLPPTRALAPTSSRPSTSVRRTDPAPAPSRAAAPQSARPSTPAPTSRKPATTAAPKPAAPSGCDPNYSGACVPIASDVDCAGGSGNGPAYVRGPVRVVGSDVYGLDSDGNGIGCE